MNTKKSFGIVLAVLGLLCAGLAFFAFVNNLRPFFVQTPSMGTTAPVGTLIIAQPQDNYYDQDIIVFYRGDRTYVHRIVEQTTDGYKTKGDMNTTADAWLVTPKDIIGKAVWIGKHLGWAWKALPFVMFGWLVVYIVSCLHFVNPLWRWPLRIMGGAIVLTTVTMWLHPWINAGMLGFTPDEQKGVNMHIVNTGIFSIKAEKTRLESGEDAIVNVPYSNEHGWFVLVPRPALSFWEMVFGVLFCISPLLISLLIKVPQTAETQRQSVKMKKRTKLGIVLVSLLTLLILSLQFSSLGALVASIPNSTNTAKTPSYGRCLNSMNASSNPRPLFAYAMDRVATRQNVGSWWNIHYEYTIPDISGHNQTGYYATNITNNALSYSVGCKNDIPARSTTFNGSNRCLVNRTARNNPTTFSIEVWFRTDRGGSDNGKIAGFGIADTNASGDSTNDRNIYLDKNGRLVFGVYPGHVTITASPVGKRYDDNQWHHVVATLSNEGMRLYADGELVGKNDNNQAQNYTGYWKFGCGGFAAWQHGDGTSFNGYEYFNGQLQYGAVYGVVLTAAQVREHYMAGTVSWN